MINWSALALVAWAVLGPLSAWKLTDFKAKWIDIPNERAAAVRETTDELTKAFNNRLAAIQQQLADKAAEARRLADEAERSIGATPVEKAALADLCQKSASCRERTKPGGENQ